MSFECFCKKINDKIIIPVSFLPFILHNMFYVYFDIFRDNSSGRDFNFLIRTLDVNLKTIYSYFRNLSCFHSNEYSFVVKRRTDVFIFLHKIVTDVDALWVVALPSPRNTCFEGAWLRRWFRPVWAAKSFRIFGR